MVDEDDAVARILERADAEDRDLEDADIAAVLDGRSAYLEAIGAVGPAGRRPRGPRLTCGFRRSYAYLRL